MEKDKMSEEDKEFIKSLKTQCKGAREILKDTCCQLPISYIEKIIDIVNKQQKEIEELKFNIDICDKDLDRLNEKIYQLKKDNKKLILGKFREVADKNEYIKSEYISKDKIREKIRILENELEENNKNIEYTRKLIYTADETIKKEIQDLKELLEE